MPNTPPRLIESVLAHALELRDQGAVDWLERATADFPELRDRIARAAGETEAVATWFTEGRTSDPHLGRVLGERFRLSRRIGAGAMGVVYVAEDQQLMREVAVKVLRGGLVDLEHSLERLLRESEAMAAVQHPSLITVHDRGQTEDGSPYLVMEWLDGQPLSVLLDEAAERAEATGHPTTHWLASEHGIDARGETSFARLAVSWIADIANGMTQVHTAGVLHRDIKPSNIVIKRDGSAVLLDFGLALLDEDSTLTRGATSIGTPAYMPPESLAGARTRKPSGDIYSLTATLYHLLALRAPYQGAPHEVLAALAMAEPEPANKLRPGLPRDLQAILEKGMQRRAHDRYPSMAALEADLRAYLDLRPVSVRPLSPLGRTWRRARRSRLAQGIAVALLAVGLVLGGRALKAHHDARLHAAAGEVRAALPPNLTTVMPAFRRYPEPADRAQVAGLLDRGVELGVDELVMRSLRASFRIDNGEARAAAEDMAWIAGALDSPFGRALLERYRALPADATHDPDLAGLPEPASAGDEYVLATLLLRAERYAEADALLAHEGVRAMWHGEELRLMGVAFGGLSIPERIERARAALAAVDALEQRLGGRTAATAHIGGRFQTIMERPRTAYAWLAEGVALSAPSHVLENNAGFAAFQLGDLEAARTHYGRAVALRPSYPKALEGLLYVHVAEHDFAEARALLAEAPVADEVWRFRHLAFVEVQAALEFQRRAEPAAMQAAMGAAREHFSRAEQLAGAPLSDTQAAILAGLESGDAEGVFLALAAFVLEDSARTWAVRHLLDHMPADLDAEGTAAMRALFERTQSLEGLRSNL